MNNLDYARMLAMLLKGQRQVEAAALRWFYQNPRVGLSVEVEMVTSLSCGH